MPADRDLRPSPSAALLVCLYAGCVCLCAGCGSSVTVIDGRHHAARAVRTRHEEGVPGDPAGEPDTARPLVMRRHRWEGEPVLHGPRFGLVWVTGDLLYSLEHLHNATSPVTAWGWQFEYQRETSADEPTWLVEFVPFAAGLEQGLQLISLSIFVGQRQPNGVEVVAGPYFSPNSVGIGFALGRTFRVGELSVPVNISITSSSHGTRYGLTFGWNLRH